MDPSLAVFCTLGSPFSEASSFRSHYHPSRAQPLRWEQQHTILSPSHLQNRNFSAFPKKAVPSSSSDPDLLPDSSSQEGNPPKSECSSPFNESWPSTEHSSSSLIPEGTKGLLSEAKALDASASHDSVSDRKSVIAKYIERFRSGQPTNRRERLGAGGDLAEFWWLRHSFIPNGDNSKKEASPFSEQSQSEARSSLFSPVLTHLSSGEMQAASTLDPETLSLQERAARLLQRSMSPLSNSGPVSSEGLGSTSTSTIRNSANTDTVLQCPSAPQGKDGLSFIPYHITPSSVSRSSKPEDDILFQWRLRRKMEEASQAAVAVPPVFWRSPCIHSAYASGKMGREISNSARPTHWRNKGQYGMPMSETPPYVKCTLSESSPSLDADALRDRATSSQCIETTPISSRIVVTGSPESSVGQTVKKPTPQEDPVPAFLDASHPPPRPTAITESLHQRTLSPVQQASQSDERGHVEPRGKPKQFRSKQNQTKPVPDLEESPRSPRRHSVQHVLAEVVAERLFSLPESPALHQGKPKRSSRTLGPEEALPKSVATPSHPQLLNMAAELLEQAEDSDGMEFEDDPLLMVLRDQRESLRRQLRAVDFQMAQPEDDSSDQRTSHH